jgi:hypothetical protein
MEAVVLTARLESMSILMMKKSVNSAVLHRMAAAVLTAQPENTGMDMDKINVSGAAQHQTGAVVRIVRQETTKNRLLNLIFCALNIYLSLLNNIIRRIK